MGSGAGHPHIAVVGATGTVGSQIAELLGARAFVYDDLKLFSFTGTTDAVQIAEQTVPVKAFTSPDDLNQSDIIFLAIPRDAADSIAALVKHAVLIDLSQNTQPGSHARSFVAPGLTSRERLRELRGHSNRIAAMNPVAQVIASVFQALGLKSGFVGAAVMLGAASCGHEALAKLFSQSADLLNARLSLDESESQIAFNVLLPPDEVELGVAISTQVADLLPNAPALAVQVVRVPAFHGSGVVLALPPSNSMSEWPSKLRSAPGILLVESGEASSFVDATRQEAVIVKLTSGPSGSVVWAVFDPARLAALTAVWIAETLATI